MLTPYPLFNEIIGILSSRSSLSMKELFDAIIKQHKTTMTNLYKIVSKLLQCHILQKEQGKISLNHQWVLRIDRLQNQVHETYQKKVNAILEDGQIKHFDAPSLQELDIIWASILSQRILKLGQEHVLYDYNAHAYHVLSSAQTEIADYLSLQSSQDQLIYVIGNDSFLDHYGCSLLQTQGINASVIKDHPFLREGYFFSAIDDYILEVMLPSVLVEYFAIFFDNVKQAKDYKPLLLRHIFHMKQKCRLTIRRDRPRADELKKVFKSMMREKNCVSSRK